jgi:Mg2+ and Co2+ transporter CorA
MRPQPEDIAVIATIADRFGVRPTASAADLRQQMSAGKFFWLDICDGDDPALTELLGALGLDASDLNWALRFGQAGRMYVGRGKLRAVTWLADAAGDLNEVHLLCSQHCIVTVWHGAAAALDEIRQQFSERADGFEDNHFVAAGILLQLLIGTLDHAIRSLDMSLDELRVRLDKDPSTDMALLGSRAQKLQSLTTNFNRYGNAVRSAIVGIEAVSGMDERGAEELNDYAEQVEDVEHQVYERRRWMSDIMHDNSMAIAQRQAEQINRLTLVSLIFLPVTALSGFFGMNFNWMIDHLGSRDAFLICGILLPALSVIISVGYFRQRGLIRFHSGAQPKPGHKSGLSAAQAHQDSPWPPHGGGPADPEHKIPPPHLQNPNSKQASA